MNILNSKEDIKPLTPEEFQQFSEFIKNETGIYLKDIKMALMSNRLYKRIRTLQLVSFKEYFDYIFKKKNYAEIEILINTISTNETYFFRNANQFYTLAKHILPNFLKNGKNRIKIWSAACSSGEEPYTIAMVLDYNKFYEKMYIEIIASDINTEMLENAKMGIYNKKRLREVEPHFKAKYFDEMGDEKYRLNQRIIKKVKFVQKNLIKDEFPFGLDVIFCKNVMIYFSRDDQKKLVNRLYKSLNHLGYLLIGHAESLYILTDLYKYMKINNTPIYFKE